MGVGIGNSISKTAAVAAPAAFVALMHVAPPSACLLTLAVTLAVGAGLLFFGSTETLGRVLSDYPDRPGTLRADALPTEQTPLL